MWVNFFQDTGLFGTTLKKIDGQRWVANNIEMFQPDLQSEAGLSIPKEECLTEQVFEVVPGKLEDVW